MHVDFLLEEPSAEAALQELLPRLLPPDATWRCYPHRGKHDLLARLPGRLKTYARQLPGAADLRVVILMDADTDCRQAKQALEKLVAEARLVSKTQAAGRPFQVLTRLAVTELEAWFLGDPAAVRAAYPGVRPTHFATVGRDPDTIADAWETLWRVLQAGGCYRAGKRKVQWATDISRHLDPARTTSASFRCFCAGLAALR